LTPKDYEVGLRKHRQSANSDATAQSLNITVPIPFDSTSKPAEIHRVLQSKHEGRIMRGKAVDRDSAAKLEQAEANDL